jgi:hypothetical protein
MRQLGVVVGVLVAFGCGDDGGSEPAFDAAPIPIDAEVITPCTSAGGAGGTHKLFLNFESQELTPGPNDATTNTTMLVMEAGTSPPWFADAGNREELITLVTDNVTSILAPFDIEVVTTRPVSGPYTMMVMGGRSADLGFTSNFGSLAAAGCIPDPNNIHLIFDQNFRNAAASVVAAYAMGFGISNSAENGSCLCWNDPACEPREGICTLESEMDVAVDVDGVFCEPAGTTTINEHQKFKQAFGCRP